jgi:hypothetical protein
MTGSSRGEERIYHISPVRRGILVGFWVFFGAMMTVPFLFMAWKKHEWPLFVVLAVAAMLTVLIPLEIAWVSRLVLTPEGIELLGFHGRKSSLSTPWSNIAAIRMDKKGAEGLITKEPLQGRAAEWLARFRNVMMNGAPLYDAEKRLLLGEQRYIPIEVFAFWLRHGDLWEQIREHAPWLADAQGQPLGYTPRIREEPWTWKKTVLLLSLMALSGVVIVGLANIPGVSPATVIKWFEGVAGVGVAIAALNNMRAGFAHLRKKHFLEAFLWLGIGIVQSLFALVLLVEAAGKNR